MAFDTVLANFVSKSPILIPEKSGTSKSYVINCLKEYFEKEKVPFLVTASTGIASILIGGKTLHSAFSVFSSNEKYFSGLSPTNINGKAMALCEVLFVDEVAMVTKEIFNLIDKKLREIRGQIVDKRFINYSFGGVMLILTGVLGQVPCVTKKGDDISEFNAMFNHMDEFKKSLMNE